MQSPNFGAFNLAPTWRQHFFPTLIKSSSQVRDAAHVGGLTDLGPLGAGFHESGKKILAACWPAVGALKCYYMINVFERGRSQLFPGAKILKKYSVAEKKNIFKVGTRNIWMH